jgi:phage-related protein
VKEAILHPAARTAIRLFPYEVRRALGKAIFDLQQGEILPMPLSRPMPSVSPGAAEIRIADRTGIYRTFYYARSASGILVFHAFVKKSQATPKHEIELGKKRLKEMLNEEN